MKDIKQEGWDEINANADKDNKKLHDKQLDLDRLYKKTFRTPRYSSRRPRIKYYLFDLIIKWGTSTW